MLSIEIEDWDKYSKHSIYTQLKCVHMKEAPAIVHRTSAFNSFVSLRHVLPKVLHTVGTCIQWLWLIVVLIPSALCCRQSALTDEREREVG
jgi:hypothetical protein